MNTTTSPLSVDALAEVFAALGQPTRLRVVRALLGHHPQGLPAGELQRLAEVPASTLSHHLDKLHQVGVVSTHRDRQWIWYRARPDTLQAVLDFLYLECCGQNTVVDPDIRARCC